MKSLLIIMFIIISSVESEAQTFDEWFRQGATQKKYLLQQIAALQVYIGYVKKGYSIAKEGLTTVSDIKKGELNLHKDYLNSLKTVSPKIKTYSKVADIIALQVRIIKIYKEAAKQVKQSGSFNADEITYISSVFERLLDDCAQTIEELIAVTTNGELEMTDDERLKRIDALHSEMQDKYSLVQSFSNEAKLLATSRISEQSDIQSIRILSGVKK